MSLMTFAQAARGIIEFTEVAIHQILYFRQIYPAEQFVRRQKYGTPVFQTRHPALREYISGTVKAFGEELVSGNVEKLIIVIKDGDDAVERFIFVLKIEDSVLPSENDSTKSNSSNSDETLSHLFRSFLIKLSTVEAHFKQRIFENNSSFMVVLELKEGEKPLAEASWKPPKPPIESAENTDEPANLIRAIEIGPIKLFLTVQECEGRVGVKVVPSAQTVSIEQVSTQESEPDTKEISTDLVPDQPDGLKETTNEQMEQNTDVTDPKPSESLVAAQEPVPEQPEVEVSKENQS